MKDKLIMLYEFIGSGLLFWLFYLNSSIAIKILKPLGACAVSFLFAFYVTNKIEVWRR